MRSMAPCWMKTAVIFARCARCTAFWPGTGETTLRGRQRDRSHYRKPELLATAPNQVWSWDITKLKGPQKWTYYYLYVMLDIFSRYVVGWLIAPNESAALAKELMSVSRRKSKKPNSSKAHPPMAAAASVAG